MLSALLLLEFYLPWKYRHHHSQLAYPSGDSTPLAEISCIFFYFTPNFIPWFYNKKLEKDIWIFDSGLNLCPRERN